MSLLIYLTEVDREAATIVVLTAVAFLTENTRAGRLFPFLHGFGIWDIFYYVWLRALVSRAAGGGLLPSAWSIGCSRKCSREVSIG